MSTLSKYFEGESKVYIEKTFKGTEEEYLNALKHSKTIYISNISTDIKEERLWHLFSMVGSIKRIIMGINKSHLTFCGFCFVEFDCLESANDSIVFFNGFLLDGKILKVDKDIGYSENRQFGRGTFGGILKEDNKRKKRFL